MEVTDEGTHMTDNHGREDSCPNYEGDSGFEQAPLFEENFGEYVKRKYASLSYPTGEPRAEVPNAGRPTAVVTAHLEPVDLTYLSDRARAYVIGLEAKLRETREQRDEWKARFESGEADKKGMDASYRKGWDDASSLLYFTISEANKKLTEILPKASALNELTPYYALSHEQMRKVREIFREIDADGAEEAPDA